MRFTRCLSLEPTVAQASEFDVMTGEIRVGTPAPLIEEQMRSGAGPE
jgi:hypothetical protein